MPFEWLDGSVEVNGKLKEAVMRGRVFLRKARLTIPWLIGIFYFNDVLVR